MKTILLSIALAASAYAGETVGVSTNLAWTGTNLYLKPIAPYTKENTFIQFGSSSEEVMRVNGLAERYIRPEKPEEITVIIWTKDGKQWKSKWEEVK